MGFLCLCFGGLKYCFFFKFFILELDVKFVGIFFFIGWRRGRGKKIKDAVISFFFFYLNVRFMLVVFGSIGRKKDGKCVGGLGVYVLFFCDGCSMM